MAELFFVSATLSQADETLNRHYELKARGYDLQYIAAKAAEISQIEPDQIYSPGRQRIIVSARSLVCFWAAREQGLSLSELARTFKMSVPGIVYAVVRGERIVKDKDLKLII